jgi:hypothetical protein
MPRRSGCLKLLFWFALADLIVIWIVGERYYNLGSNVVLYAYQDSHAPLQVKTSRGMRPLAEATVADLGAALEELHSEPGLRWCRLELQRSPGNALQGLASSLFSSEVNIITISPEHFDFVTSYQPHFQLTTARERLETDALQLSILANFRDPAGKPLGWVYHQGKQVNRPFPEWTGVFFVKGGKPWFGPKSLLDEVEGPIEEGTQGYPSVMKNHTVFSYVEATPGKYYDGQKITYRSLAGMRRDGVIILVLSGDGGVMNVAEVTEIARKLEVQHATLLDGGRALQYSLRKGSSAYHFSAFNTELDLGPQRIRPQRSPVYIGVRRKP